MIWQITKTVGYAHNLINPSIASVGWIDETGGLSDCGFHTSHPISVRSGDVVTFGPAVTSQGWHLIAYTQEGELIPKALTQKKLGCRKPKDR